MINSAQARRRAGATGLEEIAMNGMAVGRGGREDRAVRWAGYFARRGIRRIIRGWQR